MPEQGAHQPENSSATQPDSKTESRGGPENDAARSLPRFRISPILLGIAALIALAVLVGLLRSARPEDPFSISRSIGVLVGLFLWPLLASWIAFRVARRSAIAANAGFLVVLLLCVASHVTRSRTPPKAPEPASPSLADARALSEEARKASLSGDEQRALALTAESADKLRQAAATASGSQRAVLTYAAELASAQSTVLKAYIDAAAAYTAAGGGSLAGLSDAPSIDARLGLLDSALAAHDGVLDYFRNISERIPRDLASRGVEKKDAAEFLAGFTANAKVENLLAIHDLEHAMLVAAKKRLNILRAHAGRWSVNADQDLVPLPEFPQAELAEFNRLGAEINRLAEKQGTFIDDRKTGR